MLGDGHSIDRGDPAVATIFAPPPVTPGPGPPLPVMSRHDDDDDHQPQNEVGTTTTTTTTTTTNANANGPPPLPTTKELVQQCWTCGVPLHRNDDTDQNDVDQDDDDDEEEEDTSMVDAATTSSLYAMHTHPVLGNVPICCICAEAVAAQEQPDVATAKTSYCSGCAISEGEDDDGILFFLCDAPNGGGGGACPRAFCFDCVAKSYGGGATGITIAQTLANEEDDQPWNCPCCQTPPMLQSLQQSTMEYYHIPHEGDPPRKQPRHNVSYLLQQLARAEDEKERCDDMLSSLNMERQQLEIRRDIVDATNRGADEEIDGLVQTEFDLWYEEWHNHERRISDYISIVLDELDIDHQYTAMMCYHAIGKMTIIPPPALQDDADAGTTATTDAFTTRGGLGTHGEP